MASLRVGRSEAEAGAKGRKLLLLLLRKRNKNGSRPARPCDLPLLARYVSVSFIEKESGLTMQEIKHHLSSLMYY